ncbi:MAG TPA: hypothetical protein VNX28_17215 [Gemmataceae bacterium]|jgi:hypothetical protein|nr:hypothetical protein [Gemmataceae bacterium]
MIPRVSAAQFVNGSKSLYRRLAVMPRASSPDDALRQLCDTLDEVEDAWSGMPKKSPPPPPSSSDGRMYGPMPDFVSRLDDGGILAVTRGHRIEIAPDGSLKIISKLTGQTEFEK